MRRWRALRAPRGDGRRTARRSAPPTPDSPARRPPEWRPRPPAPRGARGGPLRRGPRAHRAPPPPGRCSRRARRWSRRSRSPGRPSAAAARTARLIPSTTSGSIGSAHASHPTCSAWATSISELVSRIAPARGGEPTGTISSPVGMTATRGRRRTSSSVWPAAAAAATSTGRSRCPWGSRQLARADVLPDRPHVLVRRDRGHDLGVVAHHVHVLAHHHGVVPVGHRVAGVDHDMAVSSSGRGGWSGSRPRCRARGRRFRPSPQRRPPVRSASPTRGRR